MTQLIFKFKILNETKKSLFFAKFKKKSNSFEKKITLYFNTINHKTNQNIQKHSQQYCSNAKKSLVFIKTKKNNTSIQKMKYNIFVNEKSNDKKNQQKIKSCENQFVFCYQIDKINYL